VQENRKLNQIRDKTSKEPSKKKKLVEKAKKILGISKRNVKTTVYEIKTKRPLNFVSNYITLPYYIMVIYNIWFKSKKLDNLLMFFKSENNPLCFYPNFGDEQHELIVAKFGHENFNKTLRGNLGNEKKFWIDIYIYYFN